MSLRIGCNRVSQLGVPSRTLNLGFIEGFQLSVICDTLSKGSRAGQRGLAAWSEPGGDSIVIKVVVAVLGFVAFLAFAPNSRAESGAQFLEAQTPALIAVGSN